MPADVQQALDDYRRRCESFAWNIPAEFNFARDVVDRLASGPARNALLHRDAAGRLVQLDFAQMSAAIHRVAGMIEALGIAPGERLMVLLPRVPEWQIATLGSLAAGIVAIPTSMAVLSPRDIEYRIGHSGAVAIVANAAVLALLDDLRDRMPGLRHRIAVMDAGATPPPGWIDLAAELAAATPTAGRPTRLGDPALIFYTSGTTGPPKAVLHDHGYTYTGGRQAALWHGMREGDRFWPTTGWAKAAFGPWSVGAEMVIVDAPFDAREELALLEDLAPDVFCAPPTQYRLMVKSGLGSPRWPRLRQCVAAGEPLDGEVIRAWRDATGITIRDGYGQSEAGLLIANLVGVPERPGSMGLPVPGFHVSIIDATGRELPPGEVGDIAVRHPAPGLFREYWKDPAATARCFRGDWYLTGDRAARDADGYFWFLGRADDVIISGSDRIGPFEVESLLVEDPAVVEAAAVAFPDADLGHVVKAFVVLQPGIAPTPDLEAALRARFAANGEPHKAPARFEFVASLPKTATGKIRRAELRGRPQ